MVGNVYIYKLFILITEKTYFVFPTINDNIYLNFRFFYFLLSVTFRLNPGDLRDGIKRISEMLLVVYFFLFDGPFKFCV